MDNIELYLLNIPLTNGNSEKWSAILKTVNKFMSINNETFSVASRR